MKYKILLIGDSCLDVYQYGTVDRISPEAPVPIFKHKETETKLGMASNVRKNLEVLGCHVKFLTDLPSKKIRLIDQKSKHHICRIDTDEITQPIKAGKWEPLINDGYDAVVISDYNKGLISYSLISDIRKKYRGPIFIDTKKPDLKQFEYCFIKINSVEYKASTSMHGHRSNLIVTNGADDVVCHLDDTMGDYIRLIPVPKVESFDVCGAGDTFLSALTYGYLEYGKMESAVEFAIKASTITIKHLGVYAPTLEEINEQFGME